MTPMLFRTAATLVLAVVAWMAHLSSAIAETPVQQWAPESPEHSSATASKAVGDPGTLAAGGLHTCTITDTGTVKCWG